MVSFRVRPAWDFRASSTIWRVLPAGGDHVVGEIRDGGKKTVSFFSVGLEDGRCCWEGNALPEKWWAGIEAVHGTTLFLHEYPVPSMPDHRKIFAVDVPTGKLLWKNEELAFCLATDDGVYGSKDFFDRRAYYRIDSATGEVGEEVTPETMRQVMARRPPGWGGLVDLPVADAAVHPAAACHPAVSADPLPGESIRHGEVVVMTCYDQEHGAETGRAVREHLFVVHDSAGDVLFHDTTCAGLAGPVPGAFFRVRDNLLYIKNRSILRSLSLPS